VSFSTLLFFPLIAYLTLPYDKNLGPMAALVPLFVTTFALVLAAAAADPDLLQHVCVADLTSGTPVLLLSSFLFFLFNIYPYFTS